MTVTATTLNYRKASASDVKKIRTLVQSAYRGESSRAGWTTEADLVGGERIDEEGLLEKITHPDGQVLLAFDSTGALAACCEILSKKGSVGYFGLFAVDPQRQAGGIGRMVLAQAEAVAKNDLGLGSLEMFVIWPRRELIDWYVRRGYTKTERTSPFPYNQYEHIQALRDDLHFIILEKRL